MESARELGVADLVSAPATWGGMDAPAHRLVAVIAGDRGHQGFGRVKFNVLHLVPALFGPTDGIVGGAERYALELARHMAGVVPTRLVTFGAREREERIGELRVRIIGNPWLVRGQRSNPFALRLLDELRGVDIVHCHQQHVVSSSVAAIVGRLRRQRVFCTDLGGGGWDISAYLSTDRLYDGHLHISEYSRTIAGHAGKSWAPVIFGGVDIEKFSPPNDRGRRGPVLFVGRLLPHKGVDDLIRGLPPEAEAEIIGPAPDARYLSDLRKIATGKRVVLRHECSDEALVDAYRRASCIVLPSVYRDMYGGETRIPELLGQTLLEGMACGLPAVCTAVASLPEIVRDGVTGFVVPPNDPESIGRALRWFDDHPNGAAAMGQAGRARVVATFTWQDVVDRCLDAYGLPQEHHAIALDEVSQ
jgi:glycosyltransferase involved in cell wall biosynthesis